MTNQYEIEDDVADTPDVQLDNLMAAQRALANVPQTAAERVNRSAEVVQWLYNRQQDADDMQLVSELYQMVENQATDTTRLHMTLEAAVMFGVQMDDYAHRVDSELDDLQDAAYQQDDTHPILRSFAVGIREQAEHDMRAEVREEETKGIWTEAYYKIITQLQERIRESSGVAEYSRILPLATALLNDDIQFTEAQRQALAALVNAFPGDAT